MSKPLSVEATNGSRFIKALIAGLGGFGLIYIYRDDIRRLIDWALIRILQPPKDAEILRLKQTIDQLKAEKETYKKCVDEKTEKNRSLTLRLSEVMSDKLRHNNPNITDLSDENRPVKIAEKFSELYDNQWTDAYDALGDLENKEKILLEILMKIYRRCKELSEAEVEHLKECCCIKEHEKLPAEIEIKILTARKRKALDWVDVVLEKTKTHLNEELLGAPWQQLLQTKEMEIYLSECTKLCWLMSVQTPPVTLEAEVGESCILNKELFREYTKAGKYVEYVVWPRMLLYQDGPHLAKGVAQGWDGVGGKSMDERKGCGSSRKDDEGNSERDDSKDERDEESWHGESDREDLKCSDKDDTERRDADDSGTDDDGDDRRGLENSVTLDHQRVGRQDGITLKEIAVSAENANSTEQTAQGEQENDIHERQDQGENHTGKKAEEQSITDTYDLSLEGDATEGV